MIPVVVVAVVLGESCCCNAGAKTYESSEPDPFLMGYKVHHVIGTGGFGTVYSGMRIKDGCPVAIKHITRHGVSQWVEQVRLFMDWRNTTSLYCYIQVTKRDIGFLIVFSYRVDN